MPHVDAVVVGAGLSGLSAAIGLADAGASVAVIAKGHAATHWTSGGMDVAGIAGAATSRAGVELLASDARHPYALLGESVEGALGWLSAVLDAEALRYVGDLDSPLLPLPTALGATRPAAIVPAAQGPAVTPWSSDDRLIVCGPARFKDFWPAAIVASLRRDEAWGGVRPPARIDAMTVELPGLATRRNLDGRDLAHSFDDPGWRDAAIDAIARAVDSLPGTSGGRLALPAVLGLEDHPAVMDAARRRLPIEPFEVPLVPPSIPGMRLFRALRAALRRRGGRIWVGEPVTRVDVDGRRVTKVAAAAAVRETIFRTDSVVLATGGIAGGGLIGHLDGSLEEPLLSLPVEQPEADRRLADDPLDPDGHPLEAAGIHVDGDLRPVRADGSLLLENLRVVGSMLAGQRYLRDRCGDGVAFTSGWRAAASVREAMGSVAHSPADGSR